MESVCLESSEFAFEFLLISSSTSYLCVLKQVFNLSKPMKIRIIYLPGLSGGLHIWLWNLALCLVCRIIIKTTFENHLVYANHFIFGIYFLPKLLCNHQIQPWTLFSLLLDFKIAMVVHFFGPSLAVRSSGSSYNFNSWINTIII